GWPAARAPPPGPADRATAAGRGRASAAGSDPTHALPEARPPRPARARQCAAPRRRDSPAAGDRKSTRLNSSHLGSSYAVLCLKKKKRPPAPLLVTPLRAHRAGLRRRVLVPPKLDPRVSGPPRAPPAPDPRRPSHDHPSIPQHT